MTRIVLTGGPGAGKTVISARLVAEKPDRFVLVPEAATQIYDALKTRWDRLDVDGRRSVQRRVYAVQVAQEEGIAAANPGKILLLDRGTIDGAAYWPEGPVDYWREMNSTAQRELARYDAVLWLQSAAALGLYDGDASNPIRFEDADTAVRSGEVLKGLWGNHPNLRTVSATLDLREKVAAVEQLIATLTPIGG